MPGARCCATIARTSRRTSRPSSECRLRRSSSAVAGATPAASCPRDRMRPSTNTVVEGLPTSWTSAPTITMTCRARSRSAIRCRAWSTTISVCTQTSPSGCHSGSWGHPTSAASSGHSRIDDVQRPGQLEADRRACGSQQQLFHFAPDAFGGQIVERNGATQCGGLRVEGAVEACRELHRPQHAETVVAEGTSVDRPQEAGLEVMAAAVAGRDTRRPADPRRWR